MKKLKQLMESKLFWLRTGHVLRVANDGNPVDQVVIKYQDIYFEIMIDCESGDPTGDFGWSRDPMMSHVPIREHYVATREKRS